jgi:hypothetical protein
MIKNIVFLVVFISAVDISTNFCPLSMFDSKLYDIIMQMKNKFS